MVKKSLLIVDDQTEIINAVRNTLMRDGWQVLDATTTSAAWDMLESLEEKPPIAIIDLNISGKKDGLMLARKVKAVHPQMKVVMLSGYFRDANRYPNEFFYLDKPFKISELIVLCNGLLKPATQ